MALVWEKSQQKGSRLMETEAKEQKGELVELKAHFRPLVARNDHPPHPSFPFIPTPSSTLQNPLSQRSKPISPNLNMSDDEDNQASGSRGGGGGGPATEDGLPKATIAKLINGELLSYTSLTEELARKLTSHSLLCLNPSDLMPDDIQCAKDSREVITACCIGSFPLSHPFSTRFSRAGARSRDHPTPSKLSSFQI